MHNAGRVPLGTLKRKPPEQASFRVGVVNKKKTLQVERLA
uniref:Uncharacterized protein n=1 Tax=Anguilla anguilla TaxID=7936 RepID=A0A0E9U8D2_ANGAN